MPRIPRPNGPEGTVWFGGEVERASICFRVCGDDLDPDEVTELLGQTPSRSQRKGQPVLRPNGDVLRIAGIGSWLIKTEVPSRKTLDEGIIDLLTSLPEDDAVWTSLTVRYKVDLICDVVVRGVNQGFEIPPQVLSLLGQRGITLGVDIFTEADEQQAKELKTRLGGNA